MREISQITGIYRNYLERVIETIGKGEREIQLLSHMIDSADAIHIFGFGRSGTAALAMAIRLRHFLAPGKQVFWLGDDVRDPIRKGDLVILFSGSGTRGEVLFFLQKARDTGACCFAVTSSSGSDLAEGALHSLILPPMEEGTVYGGGDFETAAWIFQEIFLTAYGRSHDIPDEKISLNHV